MKRLLAYILLALGLGTLLLANPAGARAESSRKGLYVERGRLMKGGQPYAGIGANYDTLFGRLLQNKDDHSSLDNLSMLAAKGIPFVRFRACGFYPENMQLYLTDQAEYFRRMDQVVRCAEKNHIGLIPSLFWRLATFAEAVGEPVARVGDSQSKVSQFIKTYTQALVGRYKDSPAIWGWEFGNEANNGVDNPRRGLSEPVRLSSAELAAAYRTWAQTVRRIDPSRVIGTGTTVPRPAAWHSARREPREHDSADQSYAMLLLESPDPVDLLSIHVYQKAQHLAPYGVETLSQFIGRYARYAEKVGKPLFLGEFPVRDPGQAQEYIRALTENRVPLSAFWTFDNSRQEETMNVTFQNSRAFAIDLIGKANQALQKGR